MHLGRTAGVAHLVVLKAGGDWIFTAFNISAGWGVMGDAIRRGEVVGLMILARGEVGRNILAKLLQLRHRKSLDARGDGLVGKNDDRCAVLAREVDCLDGGVKTILPRWRVR